MAGDSQARTRPMLESLRMRAKTRCGGRCRAPAVKYKTKCRMQWGRGQDQVRPRETKMRRKHGSFRRRRYEKGPKRKELFRLTRDLIAEFNQGEK